MTLYIPVNIKKRKEVIEGCGSQEIIQIATMFLVGILFGIILYKFQPVIFSVLIPAIIAPIGTYTFVRRNGLNQNTIGLLKLSQSFHKMQKTYCYIYANILKGKTVNTTKQTANDLTDVKDIRDNLIYTKSGYIIGIVRLFSINIELLAEKEIVMMCNQLSANFKSQQQPFTIFSIPRTVDMEIYLNSLISKYEEEVENPNRKMILREMIQFASAKMINGNNYEHQFYLKLWLKNEKNAERKIEESLNDVIRNYASIKNEVKRLNDSELLKLCNLYNNNNTATIENYEDSTSYFQMPRMEEEVG